MSHNDAQKEKRAAALSSVLAAIGLTTFKIVVGIITNSLGITDAHAVRIRSSGASSYVDMHITMDGNMSLTESHALTEKVEKKVHSILPKSDVTVHVEPNEMKKK